MAEESCKSNVEDSSSKKHHKQAALSFNRPKYREALWERAVKVCSLYLPLSFSRWCYANMLLFREVCKLIT